MNNVSRACSVDDDVKIFSILIVTQKGTKK